MMPVENYPVKKGDAVLNCPFGAHALYNTSDSDDLRILIVEVTNVVCGQQATIG